MADGNATLIDGLVEQLFTNTMDLICSIPNVADLFDSDDLIATDIDDTDNTDGAYPVSFMYGAVISLAVFAFFFY